MASGSKKEKSPYWHLRTAIIIFFALIVVGTVAYMLIEKTGFWDSLYMTVITISTVGYREVKLPSRAGEIFNIILIVTSLAAVAYVTASVVDLLLEGRLMNIMGRRRTLRELHDITGHYVICGYGRVGRQIAKECKSRGTGVVVIEKEPEVADIGSTDGFLTVTGDATEEPVLREAGLERAAGLVTALSSDADNLFVTMTARIIRPDVFIVGRCNSDETESKLYRAGADRAISPHNVGGRHMAALLLKPLVCDFLDVVTHGELVELTLEDIYIEPDSPIIGRSIKDLLVDRLKGAAVLGLKRPKQDFVVNPGGETILDGGDIIIMSGSPTQIEIVKQAALKR